MTAHRPRALVAAVTWLAAVAGASCTTNEPAVPPARVRAVPDVVGRSVADATEVLEDQDLVVTVVPEGGTEDDAVDGAACPDAEVVQQAPKAEQEVLPASTAVVFVQGCDTE